MTSDQLTAALDSWYIQAVVASNYLTGLYRSLNDSKQSFNAIRAGSRSNECATRLRLLDRVQIQINHFAMDHPQSEAAEEIAWQMLVEALAGVCAFFGIADGVRDGPAKGLAGSRTASFKDFGNALQGYRIAFPEAMLEEGVEQAIKRAATTCAQLTMQGIDPALSTPDQRAVYDHILDSIQDALRKEAKRILDR